MDYLERQTRMEDDRQKASIEKVRAKQQLELAQLKLACDKIKTAVPELWGNLEMKLVRLHALALATDKVTPLKCSDAHHWALCKAYSQGQLDILLDLFRELSVDPKAVASHILEESQETPKKTFLRKCLHAFLFLIKRP